MATARIVAELQHVLNIFPSARNAGIASAVRDVTYPQRNKIFNATINLSRQASLNRVNRTTIGCFACWLDVQVQGNSKHKVRSRD
jgi:hypothetical protein